MSEEELRELQELAFQLDELTQHPGWAVFVDNIRFGPGGMLSHQKRVLGGSCKTPEEYQHQVGWIAGCEFCLEAPTRVRGMAAEYSKKQPS